MNRMLKVLWMAAWPLIGAVSIPPAMAAEPAQRLQRATGLWKVVPASSPFSWDICVEKTKDRLIDDDLWADFEKECKIESQSRTGNGYSFKSSCEGGTRLSGVFKGDLDKAYSLTADTVTDVNGKSDSQHHVLNATYQGACPADLAPGSKKMRGGLVMKSLYQNR